MKRALLILSLLLALLLSACAGAPDRTGPDAPKEVEKSGASVEDCIEFIEEAATKIFGNNFEIIRDGDTVELTAWNGDVTKELPSALANEKGYVEAWNGMGTSFANLSSSIQNFFEKAEHNELTSRVSIVETSDNRTVIFAAQNGKVVYDVVNHIDTLGVNKARADAAAEHFNGLIEGAELGETIGTYKSTEVHFITGFSPETKPENWEQLQEAVIDRMGEVSVLDGTTLHVTLEAEDGTILTTITNGKVSYDVYEKAEETAALAQIEASTPDPIVYVSKSSHTIHSVSDCSDMKNYRSMKQSEAAAKGYKYCPNCW